MANIKNSISCLNMFERAVQDPCSHGCDTEDDTILQEQNQDEMDELDPLKETHTSLNNIHASDSDNNNNNTDEYITKKNTRGRSKDKNSDSGSIPPLIWNNPFGNGLDQYTDEYPQQGMLLDKRKSSTFNGIPNNNSLAIRRTRTNSSCYIQQQSRKPIRNSTNSTRKSTSISTNNNNNNNNNNKFLLQYRSKSNNNILKKNTSVASETPSIRSRSHTTNEFINNNNNVNSKWVQPSSLSHSSCSSILSHLYGLEKYISSDLDALAAEDHKANKIISNLITFPNTNNSQSDLVFSNYTNTIPTSTNTSTSANNTSEDFINGTKRQKSFIEQSLANSFSQ
ncbi:Set1/Ash2 histone methyltransferase complex subunit ASH2 [Maudiozyma exigua]|uniref:Set1/Ash2 histone methyltransferase complex subunit ASH2 n=1 Tax=Maudiozyma exigua TaxID=34358 RepID=A0A9P7B8F3_MAUEX|nr:Set1/Ash2 histone methyltransferase complex subunit ASH2 [Kazachstania exigua]